MIIGKLMAWAELHSQRHESDIYELMVTHFLGMGQVMEPPLDEQYIDIQARLLGEEVFVFWQTIKEAARQEAGRK